ncbi:hypothetical protein IWW34DRAFT_775160 [Fusarium oxysporum f. sp. albedinis]|nr:hypothetical protein IWW34DRAFT_775160 [Fusarium oxysporum f. sp. albedinis]
MQFGSDGRVTAVLLCLVIFTGPVKLIESRVPVNLLAPHKQGHLVNDQRSGLFEYDNWWDTPANLQIATSARQGQYAIRLVKCIAALALPQV